MGCFGSQRAGLLHFENGGVQALFDILRKLAPSALEAKDLRVAFFENKVICTFE
jgi:hypothetical protein